MANSDQSLHIDLRGGELLLESKYDEPLKITFTESPTEDNNWEASNEGCIRLLQSEADELVKALQYLRH